MRSRPWASTAGETSTWAVTATRPVATVVTWRSWTRVTPGTASMCSRTCASSIRWGVRSMRIATDLRSSPSARGAMRAAMSREATASAPLHPVARAQAAAAITATEPRASLATSRNAARILREEPRPPMRMSREAPLAIRPTAPTTSMGTGSTSPGDTRRHTASHATMAQMIASIPACRAAASTSERAHPHVWRSSRGRVIRWAATRATTSPEESTAMWPASAASDREPDTWAATSSAAMTPAVTPSAMRSLVREARAWSCEWPPWECPRPPPRA